MLIQFSVENFMSIKEKVTLSMLAGADNSISENTFEANSERLLKTVAMYGANASGKSNIYKALTTAIILVRRSNQRQLNEKLIEIVPFKFDSETIKKPSRFEFIFVENGTKYSYGFLADVNRIYEEYLYKYCSAKPSCIFERVNVNEYKFTKENERKLNELKEKNLENKLFLATATSWNYTDTKEPFSWFSSRIDTYKNYINMANDLIGKYINDNGGDLKKFTLKILKEADINISDYDIKSTPIEAEAILPKLPYEIAIQILNNGKGNLTGYNNIITTGHNIKDLDGNYAKYFLDMLEESDGTQSLFYLSPIIKESLELGKVVIIDEIDRSLHPLLIKFVINLFNNSEINKNNAQLIFNTHDTNLLSLEMFRRDQIYFVEKDFDTGVTDLYSLNDFSVRKKENIQKGYLQGRYGAIPFLGMGVNLW